MEECRHRRREGPAHGNRYQTSSAIATHTHAGRRHNNEKVADEAMRLMGEQNWPEKVKRGGATCGVSPRHEAL